MRCIVLVSLILLFSTNSALSQITKFTIEGHTFYKKGIARLLVYNARHQFIPFDSAIIEDGHFSISGALNEPGLFSLEYGEENRTLFIGNEHILVTEKDSITKNLSVSGSPLTNDYDYYTAKWIQPLINKLRKVNETLAGLDSTSQSKIDSLNSIQSSLFVHVPDSTVSFIRERPSSFVSLYFLNYYGDAYDVKMMKTLYSHLNNALKKYPSAEFIQQKILLGSNQSVRCPNFSVSDTNNQVISLQTFKGNYLLIDFWASWCVPCVRNIPYIQQAAVQFHEKNFKVLTVSLDNDAKAWKTALIKYNLKGISKNVLLPNTFRHPMALQFNVSSIPFNVLIDINGNIIAKNIDGNDLVHRLESISLDKESHK